MSAIKNSPKLFTRVIDDARTRTGRVDSNDVRKAVAADVKLTRSGIFEMSDPTFAQLQRLSGELTPLARVTVKQTLELFGEPSHRARGLDPGTLRRIDHHRQLRDVDPNVRSLLVAQTVDEDSVLNRLTRSEKQELTEALRAESGSSAGIVEAFLESHQRRELSPWTLARVDRLLGDRISRAELREELTSVLTADPALGILAGAQMRAIVDAVMNLGDDQTVANVLSAAF